MKRKRLWAMMMVLVLSFTMAACGSKKPEDVEIQEETEETEVPAVEPQETESATIDNNALEEKYIESVRELAVNNIDVFGREIEDMHGKPEYNHFAIVDIDGDGALELILSWEDSTVAGMWGGAYQYDFDKQEYHDEGLHEPCITFYDNGVAYEPWRHNQGFGEMWPFNASVYNASTDTYELGIIADSWNRDMYEEGFPEEVDTENAGVVYYVYKDGEELDYEHPISKSEFDAIYNQFFEGAAEVSVDYFEISEQGIQEYLVAK